jgi:hypothetical protein
MWHQYLSCLCLIYVFYAFFFTGSFIVLASHPSSICGPSLSYPPTKCRPLQASLSQFFLKKLILNKSFSSWFPFSPFIFFSQLRIIKRSLDMMIHTNNPSTWEAEAGVSEVQSQPGLQDKTLSQKEKSTISPPATHLLPLRSIQMSWRFKVKSCLIMLLWPSSLCTQANMHAFISPGSLIPREPNHNSPPWITV